MADQVVKQAGMGCAGGGFGLIWILFWSFVTCTFDVVWIGMFLVQARTWTYAQTGGTIVESRIELGRDNEGDATYDPKITYAYTVAGVQHRSETLRHMNMRMNGGKQDAERAVARYEVNRPVTVHYDPHRPQWAVLERGFRGSDFFLPLFMIPFNLVMLGGWSFLWGSWRRNKRPSGFRFRDDGLAIVARIYNVTPLVAAGVAMMVTSFILIFVCGFGMMALPADWLVSGAWCIVIAAAIGAYVKFQKPATTITIDHFSGRITIAKSDGQNHAFTAGDIVALGHAAAIEADAVDEDDESADDDAGESAADDDHLDAGHIRDALSATITYRDPQGKDQTVVLAAWSAEESAAWLIDWLEDKLRLKPGTTGSYARQS